MSAHTVFTEDRQQSFAELSGDFNPLHMDRLKARRLLFGRRIVHGIHSLLWSLDCWAESRAERVVIRELRCMFPNPVGIGDEVQCEVLQGDEGRAHIEVASEGGTVVRCQLALGAPDGTPAEGSLQAPEALSSEPRRGKPERGEAGRVELFLDPERAKRLFPRAARWFPEVQIAELLATTRLVGMICPGEDSIYSELSLTQFRDAPEDPETALRYEVTAVHERFNQVEIEVRGPTLRGHVKAFIRPRPVAQPTIFELAEAVRGWDLAGMRALVVGGSRGLGELTAKLLAAGGAEISLTFARGETDARRVAAEIHEFGGSCEVWRYDVRDPQASDSRHPFEGRSATPTHLLYFATPLIRPTGPHFSYELFLSYCAFYLEGFLATITERTDPSELKGVFYPSTAFLDRERTRFSEYVAAKAAGERVCARLAHQFESLTVLWPRLPPLSTDQTSSILPTRLDNGVERLRDELELLMPC